MRNQTLLFVPVVVLLIGCSQPIPGVLPTSPSLPTTPSADPTPCLKPDPRDPFVSGKTKMFADLMSAQRVVPFPIEVPTGWENEPEIFGISYTQADNGERHLYLLYRPWKPSEEWPIVEMTIQFGQSSLSMVETLQDGLVNACAMTAVKVGDAQGFTFWDAGVGKSNAAALIWQRDDFKISIWLTSDEGGPTESEPHPLDTLLLQLAQSLKPLQSR
jgi:hypothetical protein